MNDDKIFAHSLFDDFLAEPIAFDRNCNSDLRQIIARQFEAALQSQHTKNVDLVDALYLLEMVTQLTGDVQRAIDWYRRERLALFNGKTPEAVLAERRMRDLMLYVFSPEASSLERASAVRLSA